MTKRIINDLDLNNFNSLEHIKTSSIWVGKFSQLKPKDFGDNNFHTRFHPEIPYQMMMRYTKKGETVWDPFAGSGTTIDVGRMLGRKVIANDLFQYREDIIKGDSRSWRPDEKVQLVILHPPYWKMYHYSDDPLNLCNEPTASAFAKEFGAVINNVKEILENGRFLILVISDVYTNGEQIPLDFLCYSEIKKFGYILKGRIVKDFGETKGTTITNAKNSRLWRYRALKFGFWELGIDNILVFQKGERN